MPLPEFHSLPEDAQTISLLGDTLRSESDPIPEALSQRIDSLIIDAEEDEDLMTARIWEARRLGYNGEYREALALLNAQLPEATEDLKKAEILRHTGHRYITLRAFDFAIIDLENAAGFAEDSADIVEQDGLPNSENKPRSTLKTNIWYHLGLAQYLEGNFESAAESYQNGIELSTNDDMLVAMLYWYYMALKRQGLDMEAGQLLSQIRPDMDVIENDSYLKLLLVFKGEFDSNLLIDEESDELTNSTIGYGLGNWHYMNGRTDRANEIWSQVYNSGNWPAFGYIASEAELARLK